MYRFFLPDLQWLNYVACAVALLSQHYTVVFPAGIRQLQCILMKVALLLGVEVHVNVAFEELIEPPEDQSSRE